jgi:hypothetical protein
MSCSCNVDAAYAAPFHPAAAPHKDCATSCPVWPEPAPPRRLIKLPARLFLFQLGERRRRRARRVASRCQTSNEQCTPQTWMLRCTTATSSRFHVDAPGTHPLPPLSLSSDAAEAPQTSRSQPRAKSRHAEHPCWADNNIWRQPLAALVGNDRLRFPGVSWGFLLCSWSWAFFLSSDLLTCCHAV